PRAVPDRGRVEDDGLPARAPSRLAPIAGRPSLLGRRGGGQRRAAARRGLDLARSSRLGRLGARARAPQLPPGSAVVARRSRQGRRVPASRARGERRGLRRAVGALELLGGGARGLLRSVSPRGEACRNAGAGFSPFSSVCPPCVLVLPLHSQ